MRELTSRIGLLLALVVFALGVAHASAFASSVFTEPGGAPPTTNADQPLNIGSADQTKAGGIWADRYATDNRYALGATSGWFVDSGKTTIVAQQYCIGNNGSSASGNTCVTAFPGSPASCSLERQVIERVPMGAYYQKPYNDYCQELIGASGSPIPSGQGWTATGSDDCAEYLGDGDNCNGSHKGALLQCTYVRMVCDGTGVSVTSTSRNY